MATIMSMPPRRPSQPRSDTRTSYQVGSPWMLLGKMLRGLTGTPMRRIALANSSLALAEPEPLTLANLTTKSLVASRRVMVPGSSFRCHLHRDVDGSAGRLRHLHQELLHVPGPRRATL